MIIDGKVVMHNRKIITVNENEILTAVGEIGGKIKKEIENFPSSGGKEKQFHFKGGRRGDSGPDFFPGPGSEGRVRKWGSVTYFSDDLSPCYLSSQRDKVNVIIRIHSIVVILMSENYQIPISF